MHVFGSFEECVAYVWWTGGGLMDTVRSRDNYCDVALYECMIDIVIDIDIRYSSNRWKPFAGCNFTELFTNWSFDTSYLALFYGFFYLRTCTSIFSVCWQPHSFDRLVFSTFRLHVKMLFILHEFKRNAMYSVISKHRRFVYQGVKWHQNRR